MGQPPSDICTLGVVFMSSKTIGETARFLGFYANVKFYCSLDMTFSRILVFHSNCFMFLNGNLNRNYHINLTIIQSKLVCTSHYVNRPFPSSGQSLLQSESKCEIFVMVISSHFNMNEN